MHTTDEEKRQPLEYLTTRCGNISLPTDVPARLGILLFQLSSLLIIFRPTKQLCQYLDTIMKATRTILFKLEFSFSEMIVHNILEWKAADMASNVR